MNIESIDRDFFDTSKKVEVKFFYTELNLNSFDTAQPAILFEKAFYNTPAAKPRTNNRHVKFDELLTETYCNNNNNQSNQ